MFNIILCLKGINGSTIIIGKECELVSHNLKINDAIKINVRDLSEIKYIKKNRTI